MNLTFQALSKNDIPNIVLIENQSFQEPWSRDGFRDMLSNPSFQSMGVFVDRKLHVMNVAVDPIYRKQGLGENLLGKVHDFGKKHGSKIAYLEVRESNQSAVKLYEKLGYRKQGRRIKYYSNQEDALLMFKDL
jgi:ribosomal-protein-alanine N-acetyltransferase